MSPPTKRLNFRFRSREFQWDSALRTRGSQSADPVSPNRTALDTGSAVAPVEPQMLSCKSRASSPGPRVPNSEPRAPKGYALLLLMMAVTLLLVSLTVSLPSIYMQDQREREEELKFRLNEYGRAISMFRQKFQRFPQSVDELVKKTNGMRFLRHAYTDPMSKNGKWRFIHANAQGMLLDSRTMGPAAQQTAGLMGAVSSAGELERRAIQERGGALNTAGVTPADQQQKACEQKEGVASCSRKESISIWMGRKHYDEWECLGAAGVGISQPCGGQTGVPGPGGVQMPGGAQTGVPGPGGSEGEGGQSVSPTGQGPQKPQTPELPPLTDQPEPEPEPEPEPPEPNQ